MLELQVTEGDRQRRLLFSGDVGQWDKPLMRDPTTFDEADYVVMESTYGDRDHPDDGDIETQLCDVINQTASHGGAVIIPTFAVERAQEVMYHISRLVYADRIPDLQIFLDSPMAVDVTQIFRKHRDCFDDETWQLIDSDEPPLRFAGLKLVRSVQDSKAINSVRVPCVIMATSGMCTAGRVKHHLKDRIGDPHNTVLFVGYQGRGTLGRQILEGKQSVRIHGRMRNVRAKIRQIHGFSGHADRRALLRWLAALRNPPRRLFLTHGEEEVSLGLVDHIRAEMGWSASVPRYRDSVELE
jgi:metallo-beta-lactamase family protein